MDKDKTASILMKSRWVVVVFVPVWLTVVLALCPLSAVVDWEAYSGSKTVSFVVFLLLFVTLLAPCVLTTMGLLLQVGNNSVAFRRVGRSFLDISAGLGVSGKWNQVYYSVCLLEVILIWVAGFWC